MNLVGQKFNRLLVIQRAENLGIGHKARARWLCLCDCGNNSIVITNGLTSGKSQSCGCLQKEKAALNKKTIQSGTKFNRFTVLMEYGRTSKQKVTYLCKCDCGKEKVIDGVRLRNGAVKSCGCLQIERARMRFYKDGFTKNKLYNAWVKRFRKEHDSQWTAQMEILLHQTQTECAICGKKDYLTVDHIKPVSKGFGLAPDNAIILCKNCNSSKGNKDLSELPNEWVQKIVGASNNFFEVWAAAQIVYNDARRRGL